MSNLTLRLITGSIFVVVLVGCIMWSPFSFFILLLAITILGLNEFYKLSTKAGAETQSVFGIVAGGLIVTVSFLAIGFNNKYLFALIFPIVFAIFFIELYRKRNNPFSNIAWTIIGLIYIAIPMAMLTTAFVPDFYFDYFIGSGHGDYAGVYDSHAVLLLFVLIWVSDSMAYVCGRLFGKHKLWERISPKKTWEGFIGGALFTVAVAGVTIHLVKDSDNQSWFPEIRWMGIALITSVAGMLGDLTESLFKRSIDVKDSGTILPGHGGILDRFDALFLATPFTVSFIWLTDLI